ncbi:outer membrane usher protein [Salmonella enterica subsp. enterica serovar Choleraesuis]|nr:outer membrane usher protein [Salmonella enterica subsp. enterica serovar Choleraesuis]
MDEDMIVCKLKKYHSGRKLGKITLVSVFFLITPAKSWGTMYFNPAFLSGDTTEVADLSRFINNGGMVPGIYRVDVYLNDEFITASDINFTGNTSKTAEESESQETIKKSGLIPCFSHIWIDRFGVNTSLLPAQKMDASQCIDFTSYIKGFTWDFNVSRLRLDITIPQAMLVNRVRGYISPNEWDEGINAALMNYSFSGDSGTGGHAYYLNLSGGLNYGAWRLRHTGAWSYASQNQDHKSKWNSIETYIKRDVIPFKGELKVGDAYSDGYLFDTSAFRGVNFYSVDNMYPDSQQGYAPVVRGIAKTSARVVIRQSGYTIYQISVPPGPFEIRDLNPQVSGGDLDVSIEEKDGSVQSFTQPYSSVPALQREGRLKYNFIGGQYRSGTGDQDKPTYFQTELFYGLPHGYTIYGGTQLAARYHAAALGLGVNIGTFGAFSTDITQANSELADHKKHQGQSVRFLYAKSMETTGTTFQLTGYRYSTKGFYSLSDVAYRRMEGIEYEERPDGNHKYEPVVTNYHNLNNAKKGRFQVNISQQLSDFGSLYMTGNQQTYWNDTRKDRWLQLGYTAVWRGIHYSLSWSYNKSNYQNASNRLVAFNVSVPLGALLGGGRFERSTVDEMYATASMNHSEAAGTTWNSGVSGTLLKDRNLSYSVAQGHSTQSGGSGNVNASWRNGYGTIDAGYNYSHQYHDFNYRVSGGAILHGNGLTFGQTLGESNVLIKAPGASGVKVKNATGVSTDWRGYTYLPYATVYRNNQIDLDVNSLDDHTDLDISTGSIVPTEGAIVRLDFKARKGIRGLFTLTKNGRPLPFGAMISDPKSGSSGMVGDNGVVYMNALPLKGELYAKWGSESSSVCRISYSLSKEVLKKSIVRQAFNCTP